MANKVLNVLSYDQATYIGKVYIKKKDYRGKSNVDNNTMKWDK